MTRHPSNPDPWRAGMGESRGLSRLFGEGELWLRWAIPIGRIFGVRVMLHWGYLALVVSLLIFSLPHHQSGFGFRIVHLGSLMLVGMFGELTRALVCRSQGGETDEIVLWPLGGLGVHHAPRSPGAELRVSLAGVLTYASVAVVLGGVLFVLTGSWRAALPNPLDIGGALPFLAGSDGRVSWLMVGVWSLHASAMLLLVFNLLVPMPPSSASETLRVLLVGRVGLHRARWLAAQTGLVSALVLAVCGALFTDGKWLLLVGAFGAAVSWGERRRIQFLAGQEPGLDLSDAPEREAIDPLEADQGEIDRVLQKISEVGMEGLSGRERRLLKRATQASRETEGRGGISDE